MSYLRLEENRDLPYYFMMARFETGVLLSWHLLIFSLPNSFYLWQSEKSPTMQWLRGYFDLFARKLTASA